MVVLQWVTFFKNCYFRFRKVGLWLLIGLMYAVQFWNDYTNFKIYINKNELFNFQMKLRNMVMDNDIPDEGGIDPNTIANAAVIVAILPFAIIYPFCQKYFVQGVNVGAVKE